MDKSTQKIYYFKFDFGNLITIAVWFSMEMVHTFCTGAGTMKDGSWGVTGKRNTIQKTTFNGSKYPE